MAIAYWDEDERAVQIAARIITLPNFGNLILLSKF
jgi:hypothetical protein